MQTKTELLDEIGRQLESANVDMEVLEQVRDYVNAFIRANAKTAQVHLKLVTL